MQYVFSVAPDVIVAYRFPDISVHRDSISSMIEGAVVAQPKEVDDWIFVVQGWADEDNALPEDIRIQRENS